MDRCFTFQWGGGGGVFFRWEELHFSVGVHPMERDIRIDGRKGGGIEKNRSEELKKCPPPSTAVQRIADVVRERKPR